LTLKKNSSYEPTLLVNATKVYNLRSDAVIGQDEIMVINTKKLIQFTISSTSMDEHLVDAANAAMEISSLSWS
jgi:hypothetical protein